MDSGVRAVGTVHRCYLALQAAAGAPGRDPQARSLNGWTQDSEMPLGGL